MPYTLLLADDSATIQRVVELTFAGEDVTVVAVGDGDQAIAQLEASAPDIVLADIGMPGKNGYDVAQYIRQSPALSHIPVVLLTGAFEPVDQARADEVHCDGVLAKPFEPQLVIGRVKELLARRRRGSDDAAAATDVQLAEPPVVAAAEHVEPGKGIEPAEQGQVAHSLFPAVVDRSDYFDRLDAAFSKLTSDTPGQTEPPVAAPVEPQPSAAEAVAAPAPLAAPDDRLAPIEESQPIEPEAAPLAPTALRPIAAPAPQPPAPNQVAMPALADAFAVLLAAEQHEPPPARSGPWPSIQTPSAEVREELVEEVVRRVLDRLSATVREAVADVASQVAERVIREEIERIKASIK